MKNQITQIKNVLSAFMPNEITTCLDDQIQLGCNRCIIETDSMAMINILTTANYISGLVAQGYSMKDALRKLGSQMRQFSMQPETKAPMPFKRAQATLKLK